LVVCINIFHHPKFHAKISLPTPLLEAYFYVFILNDKFLCDKYAHRFLIFHHLIYLKKLLAQVQANQISSKFTRIIPFVTIHFKTLWNFAKQHLWLQFLRTLMCFLYVSRSSKTIWLIKVVVHMVKWDFCNYGLRPPTPIIGHGILV
jgi:hypothetical protein